MSQSMAKAVKYISAPENLRKALLLRLFSKDLEETNVEFIGTDTIKYQNITFGSSALGSYSTADGYTGMDIVSAWKTLTLSQDKGNTIKYDKITEDEEVAAIGLVKFVERYINDVQSPAVDLYRFTVIVAKTGVQTKTTTLTNTTVLGEVLLGFSLLKDKNINTEDGLLLFITPTLEKLLREASLNKGYYRLGDWDGGIQSNVETFDGAKIITVPVDRMPVGVQFILMHKSAAPAFVKYIETVIHDKIPGHGNRRIQADIGMYHDCFVYDELVGGIFVSKVTTQTLTFNGSTPTTGTMAAKTLSQGQSIQLPANVFVKTGQVFTGWDTDVSADEVVYLDQGIFTMSTADVTLYAVWAAE